MTNIVQEVHGSMRNFVIIFIALYLRFFVTSREHIYDLMCGLYAYNKGKENSTGATYFLGGRPLP